MERGHLGLHLGKSVMRLALLIIKVVKLLLEKFLKLEDSYSRIQKFSNAIAELMGVRGGVAQRFLLCYGYILLNLNTNARLRFLRTFFNILFLTDLLQIY